MYSIKITCDIAQDSYSNSNASHSNYECLLSGRTGSKVVEILRNLIYYKLNMLNIHSINISLVDRDYKIIHFKNKPLIFDGNKYYNISQTVYYYFTY